MNALTLLLLLAAVLASCLAEIKTEEGVLVLTDDNFDGTLRKNLFYSFRLFPRFCVFC